MRKHTYHSTILQFHHTTSYIQTSRIGSIPQLSYDKVITKVIIAIQYFLMPQTVIFLSSHRNAHLRTTSQIHILSVDSNHSLPIYLLQYQSSPKYIFSSLIPGNRVIINLTLTLIDGETTSLSGKRVVVKTKYNSN